MYIKIGIRVNSDLVLENMQIGILLGLLKRGNKLFDTIYELYTKMAFTETNSEIFDSQHSIRLIY